MIKKDLLTGDDFEAKRINQKFANPHNRIRYYNRKANELRHKTANVNKQLHMNLRILNELTFNNNELVVHKQYLLGKGFSFEVLTHLEIYEKLNRFAIYNYTILSLENEQIKIIKK